MIKVWVLLMYMGGPPVADLSAIVTDNHVYLSREECELKRARLNEGMSPAGHGWTRCEFLFRWPEGE